MTANEVTSLRARLKADTRASHVQLDAMVSRFDLTTPKGFSCFLQMQFAALSTIEPQAKGTASFSALQDLLYRANSDLRAIDTRDRSPARALAPLQPLAIDYVIAGSRLGTQVLRNRWLAATDTSVHHANAYFSAPSYIDLWTSFCRSSEAMSPRGPSADRIVRDACRLFQLYADFARPLQATDGVIHA